MSVSSLKKIAEKFNINISHCKNKNHISKTIQSYYDEMQKFHDYTYIRQLGSKGKDGRTFLAQHKNGKKYAVKIFKKSKNSKRIEKEAQLQHEVSKYGISVPVFECNGPGKYISMEILDKTLFDVFVQQNFILTLKQQKEIISLFQKLDKAKVFHADPNPLNFMYKKSKLYIIDFGFSSKIDEKCIKKYGNTPNMKYMPLGLIIHLKKIHKETDLFFLSRYIDASLLK